MIRNILFYVVLVCFFTQQINAQYASTKVKEKHDAYTDSLKQVKYDNVFPIFGQKAYQKGFDIPYPTGVMVNYMYIKQGIIVDNLRLGLLTDEVDIPLTDVDFIAF